MDFLNQLSRLDLILGSQSPRRKALLESAGFCFRTWVLPTGEEFPDNLSPSEVARFLCVQKAAPFENVLGPESILITADTIVVKDNIILNKAANSEEALSMLNMLNGSSHEVITGVCISSEKNQVSFTETTKVFFNQLSTEELHWYINQYRPFDKAGAYGIQEWIGLTGIGKIEGCYYNVVGLPVPALYAELKSFVKDNF
jgi:septum formation protein